MLVGAYPHPAVEYNVSTMPESFTVAEVGPRVMEE